MHYYLEKMQLSDTILGLSVEKTQRFDPNYLPVQTNAGTAGAPSRSACRLALPRTLLSFEREVLSLSPPNHGMEGETNE